jgi:hypothetical protein
VNRITDIPIQDFKFYFEQWPKTWEHCTELEVGYFENTRLQISATLKTQFWEISPTTHVPKLVICCVRHKSIHILLRAEALAGGPRRRCQCNFTSPPVQQGSHCRYVRYRNHTRTVLRSYSTETTLVLCCVATVPKPHSYCAA